MVQEEEMRLVPKTATEAPSQETLAGSCRSAAVWAMSLPNDLPGHWQHLGPRADHCEAKVEALKRLKEAGWATYNTIRLTYQIQVVPLLAQTDLKITVALLKMQLTQLLYDAERCKHQQTFIRVDFPADIHVMYNRFTSWVYKHEKEICCWAVPVVFRL